MGELLCGGRLQKRLKNETDYLTCGWLDDERDRAFIGTSGGDMFILDIAKNPPNFLHTVDLGTKPTSQICVNRDSLLVAHCDCVSVLSFEEKGMERRMTRVGTHRSKYLDSSEATILAVTAAPERQLIFGGYSDGSVAIWRHLESEAFTVLQAHQCDCNTLKWVHSASWGSVLLTGGGDGKVTMWNLTGVSEDYAFWVPQGADTDQDGFPSLDASLVPLGGALGGSVAMSAA